MENTNPPAEQSQQANVMQQILPNSTTVLVLGIISIATCWCYGFIGLTLGIIALVLSGKALKLLKDNPENYTEGSIKNMKAGRTCAIIGTVLSSIYFLIIIIYVLIVGVALGTIFTSTPWESFL